MGCISDSGTASAAPTGGSGISRGRALRVAVAAGVMLIVLGGTAPVAPLEIDVAKLRSGKGLLQICLTSDPDNFPACIDDAHALTRSIPATQTSISFDALPLGNYAAAVIHDENRNKKLDTMLGIPREGFGFSRNPAIGFGPPRFSAARFKLDDDGGKQRINMRYLL